MLKTVLVYSKLQKKAEIFKIKLNIINKNFISTIEAPMMLNNDHMETLKAFKK